jgi:hypothetical protein
VGMTGNPWTDLNEEELQRIGLVRKFGVELRAGCDHAIVRCALVTYSTSKEAAAAALRQQACQIARMLLHFAEGNTNPLMETALGSMLYAVYPTDDLPRIEKE